MTFTVLGATGFVGGYLTRRLRTDGQEVFAPSRGDDTIFARPLGHTIYCIGLTADFRSRPFATVEAHVTLLARILEQADFDSLTYISSTRVYLGGDLGREDATLMVSSLDLSGLYNLTKLTGESICFHSGRANVKVVRLSNVIGDDTNSPNFVFDIARDALRGHVQLATDPSSAKDYIAIDDVAELLPRIAVEGRERLYNLAAGVKIRHREWLLRLQELTGCTFGVAGGAPVSDFPDIDVSRIRDEFDYVPSAVLDYLPDILAKLRAETR